MSFVIVSRAAVERLCTAEGGLLSMLQDGTLAAALGPHVPAAVDRAVAGYDELQASWEGLATELDPASPFLRHREAVLDRSPPAEGLRRLIVSLADGRECNVGGLLLRLDERHRRMALECLVAFAVRGALDLYFWRLVGAIRATEEARGVAA